MTSSTNIVVDIWILFLPVEALLRIQRPKREKTALICIFALGALSCISSIIRLYTIRLYTEVSGILLFICLIDTLTNGKQSTDKFADSTPINAWSMVEINTGIYCACLPALKALFSSRHRNRNRTRSATGRFFSVEGGEVASIKTYPSTA